MSGAVNDRLRHVQLADLVDRKVEALVVKVLRSGMVGEHATSSSAPVLMSRSPAAADVARDSAINVDINITVR